MMRSRRGWAAALAVALGGALVPGEARALEDPPATVAPLDGVPPMLAAPSPSPSPSPAPSASVTPLVTRPKPIALAPDTSDSDIGWKIVALLALIGGGAYSLRKRFLPAAKIDDGRLTIVRRASIGIRSELLVVNVEGQRLLIGVTPNSIQSLAILDADPPEAVRAGEGQVAGGPTVGERFAAMLQAADARPSGSSRAERAEAAPAEDEDGDMAGQARGLLALRRRG